MKKRILMEKRKRVTGIAYVLAMMLAISPLASFQAYGASLGDPLLSKSLTFSERAALTNGVYWNSSAGDKITENYIEYEPGGTVLPVISNGNDIYGAASFRAVTAQLKSEGSNVIAGVNGDFFDMNTGVPIGMTIKDGIVLSSESYLYPSVGFRKDGSALISRVDMNIRIDGPALAEGIQRIHLNKTITTTSGVMLYTVDFADDDTNKATIPTYNVLLDVGEEQPVVNGTISATVNAAYEATVPTVIPQGQMLLSMAAGTSYLGTLDKLKGLKAGDPITITIQADEAWNDVVYAVGGGDKLLTAGVNVAPKTLENNPHTALGIKDDGTILFYTVDGRQPGYSKGTTLAQLADRLAELGCVEAINLDGGGSTAIYSVYPGDSTLSLLNTPSQTTLRNCANYILLVNQAEPTGNFSRLFLYPYSVRMLAGATQTFTAKATDERYYQVKTPGTLSYSVSGKVGAVDAVGMFNAGSTKGSGEILVKSGSRTGTAKVEVISKPDSILITDGSGKTVTGVSVNGGDSLDFSAQAISMKMPLVAQDSNFTWSVQGNIGTIDANGVFTASNIPSGSGSITAAAGGTAAILPVNVTSEGMLIESFEGTANLLQIEGIPGLTTGTNQDLTKVRYGYGSGSVAYDFSAIESDVIALPVGITFQRSPGSLNLWIYGDGSGNTLSLKYNGSGGTGEAIAAVMDFTGWRHVAVGLPKGVTRIDAFQFLMTGGVAGTIYMDQIMGSIGYYMDIEPPAIQLTVSGQAINATVSDLMDVAIPSDRIRLTYDGTSLQFQYDSNTKALSAVLPEPDGNTHRISVIAEDKSGNLQRAGMTIIGEATVQPFVDMTGHWALASTGFLYNRGIVSGVPSDTGLAYKPNNNLNRAEFAVLMSKWLGVDPTLYSQVELPFEDVASIPSWAMDSVRAMYGMGVIKGSGADGKLYFKPAGSISREEVMTIIGRTQARGYQESDLSAFADKTKVSSWALPYVKSLVQQGTVSGYDGKLWPKDLVTRAQVAVIIMSLI